MNYHRESIFTGQSVYWRCKIYAGKKIGSLSYSKLILYLRNMQWRGAITDHWLLYLRDNSAVELMILVTAIWKIYILIYIHIYYNILYIYIYIYIYIIWIWIIYIYIYIYIYMICIWLMYIYMTCTEATEMAAKYFHNKKMCF